MAQWNNSTYNNQYQDSNTWNGEANPQHPYYNRQYDSNNQYVSFNEFLSQMQDNVPPANSSSNTNLEYQNYSINQYNYTNVPSTSHASHQQRYQYQNTSNGVSSSSGSDTYQGNAQYDTRPSGSSAYTSELVLKSNLTPTATEFVPKNISNTPSTSTQDTETVEVRQNGDSRNKYNSEANWRDRPQSAKQSSSRQQNENPRSNDSYYNNKDNINKRNQDRYREYNNRRHEPSSNTEFKSREPRNNRDNDSSNNSEPMASQRNGKAAKLKNKETDNPRTFYNSSINKTQDTRSGPSGRGDGSARGRNWAGTQRLRTAERDVTEDEDYAKSYLDYRENKNRDSKTGKFFSPAKYKNKIEQGNTELTQRERLSDQLDKGTLECLVCCERVKQTDSVWWCTNCYHVLHLRCVSKWARSSMVENKWRCPACQNVSSEIPTEYRCMCGAVRSPEYQRGATIAHTCGKACKRPRSCPHPCTLLCHPGPCPPCQATINKKCGCGSETRSVLCSSKLPQVCNRVCQKLLECGVHKCAKDCHEGPCDSCNETVEQVCYCPAGKPRTVACNKESGTARHYSCGAECSRILSCGAHVCRGVCHAPPCGECPSAPDKLLTCPCGKTRLAKDARKLCTDPIPLCGNICTKPLACGPQGDKHFCKINCHDGACPICPDSTLVQCRCGHSTKEIPCVELLEMGENVLCQRKCNKKLSCGRHKCRSVCCASVSHRCSVVCGRMLSCQLHRCEQYCHTGHCAPCPRQEFNELRCECGASVILPPIPCGTKPPACSSPCRRTRECGHPPHHSCHPGDCPPCCVLTTKRCYGDHEERKTIPCSQGEFSCGLPCGKPLPCGKHTCIKICHRGSCDSGKCTQPCTEKRADCGHECAAPCHSSSSSPCPSRAPCRRPVRATCPCGRRSATRACADNAKDMAKILSALAAQKMQEGGSVDISDVQRPGAMLKTLDCDDECRMEARARQLALALQIRNPDVSSKLAPRYSDFLRTTATKEPSFAQQIHDKLTELVQLAKKSKQKTRSHSFPSMSRARRQYIHELCEHFGCESVAYDAEPNRNVVATAYREKSWLPAMSVLEVLAREAGKRKVPGPILRASNNSSSANVNCAPSTASKPSTTGWATLTSSNAWAARSQPKQQPPETKIDYFDNPPEN